jgi:hypothetical protein
MACSETYADANDFRNYWCIAVEEEKEAQLNNILRRTASRINAARHASNQCDCSLADWATEYLKELNILAAVAIYKCPCSGLSMAPDERTAILAAVQADFQAIRESKIELCAGETGADFPYTGSAQQGISEFARAQIIANDVLRNS